MNATMAFTLCVPIIITIQNKWIRITCAILWTIGFLTQPQQVPYYLIGSIIWACVGLIINAIIKRMKNKE